MDLHILSMYEAVEHIPVKPTYAIRIFNSTEQFANKIDLQGSFLGIDEYRFDDNEERMRMGPVSIDDDIARKIIENFIKYKDRVESLLVHCNRGENRSPSVAMGLNEIFGLGNDSERLLEKFPDYNQLVYRTLQKVGGRYK